MESIIFRNIFICAEKLNYITNYMKTRGEPGGEDDPLPILYWEKEQKTYTRRRRSAKYERFIKIFLKRDQDRLNWIFLCENKTMLFSSFRFFRFIMCLPRNSIPCYASIIPSALEEFRPVSA